MMCIGREHKQGKCSAGSPNCPNSKSLLKHKYQFLCTIVDSNLVQKCRIVWYNSYVIRRILNEGYHFLDLISFKLKVEVGASTLTQLVICGGVGMYHHLPSLWHPDMPTKNGQSALQNIDIYYYYYFSFDC